MNLHKRLATIPAVVLLSLPALQDIASANAYTADATCTGLTFEMPRAEDGTVVRAYNNGRLVRTQEVATFGDAVRFTLATPDDTVSQSWRVEIDSLHNDDHVFAETVPACVVVTTSSAPTTTVAVTTPPVPSTPTTVVTPPRVTTTTVATTVPPTFTLPETGQDMTLPTLVAAVCVLAGAAIVHAVRRSPK